MFTRFSRRLYRRSPAASLAMSSAAAASSSSPLKVLVIDGYAPEGRAELEAGGASTAGSLYIKLLNKSAPAGVTIASDVVYPSDHDFQTPELSKVSYNSVLVRRGSTRRTRFASTRVTYVCSIMQWRGRDAR